VPMHLTFAEEPQYPRLALPGAKAHTQGRAIPFLRVPPISVELRCLINPRPPRGITQANGMNLVHGETERLVSFHSTRPRAPLAPVELFIDHRSARKAGPRVAQPKRSAPSEPPHFHLSATNSIRLPIPGPACASALRYATRATRLPLQRARHHPGTCAHASTISRLRLSACECEPQIPSAGPLASNGCCSFRFLFTVEIASWHLQTRMEPTSGIPSDASCASSSWGYSWEPRVSSLLSHPTSSGASITSNLSTSGPGDDERRTEISAPTLARRRQFRARTLAEAERAVYQRDAYQRRRSRTRERPCRYGCVPCPTFLPALVLYLIADAGQRLRAMAGRRPGA